MNIIRTTKDKKLFRPYLELDGKLASWNNWFVCLCCLYGIKIPKKYAPLVMQCTGRSIESMPIAGFKTALLLVGRRGGKSKISGLVAAFESCLSGREKFLSVGEKGLVTVVSPSRFQSGIIKSYIRAALSSPMLDQEVVKREGDGYLLSNGILVQVLVGDFRLVRGFTQICVICDEICYMHLAEEGKIRSDTELISAVRPALITTGGKCIAVSTKYQRKGWAFKTWKKNFKNENGKILVWDAPSMLMNPTLDQSVIDEAMQEDRASALAEFGGQWRENIANWLPREVIEAVVKRGRLELLPRTGEKYRGFVDVSGGRQESSSLAIAHRDNGKVILDYTKEYRSPHSPNSAISDMSEKLKRFKIRQVVADNYAAEFVVDAFQTHGISCTKSKLSKSNLYLELLPAICSESVELLDNEILINQLSNLVRKTRSGGKDSVDHCTGAKDDVANAAAGVCVVASGRKRRVGGVFRRHKN